MIHLKLFESEPEPGPGPLLLMEEDDPGKVYWVNGLIHIRQIRQGIERLKCNPGPRRKTVKMLANEIWNLTEELIVIL